MWAWLVPLLRAALSDASNDCVEHWTAALRFCIYDRDPRRVHPLLDLLLDVAPVTDDAATSFAQFRQVCARALRRCVS